MLLIDALVDTLATDFPWINSSDIARAVVERVVPTPAYNSHGQAEYGEEHLDALRELFAASGSRRPRY